MTQRKAQIIELSDENGSVIGYRATCEELGVVVEAQSIKEVQEKMQKAIVDLESGQTQEESSIEQIPGDETVLNEQESGDQLFNQMMLEFNLLISEIGQLYDQAVNMITQIHEDSSLPRAYAAINILYATKSIANAITKSGHLLEVIDVIDRSYVDSHGAVQDLIRVFDSVEREEG